MKNIIFTCAFIALCQCSFGQSFTQAGDNTGFVYDCDNNAGAEFSWTYYFPTCTTGTNGGGGSDESATDLLSFTWSQSANGQAYIILNLTNALNLSSAANQRIKFTLRSVNATTEAAMPLNYTLRIEDASNVQLIDPIALAVTGTDQLFDLDLSTHIASGQSLSAVKKIYFHYDGCPSGTVYNTATSNDAKLFLSNYSAGSLLTTSIADSEGLLVGANVYPNPSNGLTNIQVELPSTAEMKIALMDVYGKEVKVIAEGNYTSINESFDVSDIAKGIYFVHYTINGKASKVQRLVVR
jgi:hypothetical protein